MIMGLNAFHLMVAWHLHISVSGLSDIHELTGTCNRTVDPCDPTVYEELDEPTRSIRYGIDQSLLPVAENDVTLSQAWYRSTSGAGSDMPTRVVETGQCNAYAPIWLNGSIPNVEDGIIYVDGCASFLYNKCVRRYAIPMKNCGGFNVYCLFPLEDPYDRFCLGSEMACPENTTSPTGFTPGCTSTDDPTSQTSKAQITASLNSISTQHLSTSRPNQVSTNKRATEDKTPTSLTALITASSTSTSAQPHLTTQISSNHNSADGSLSLTSTKHSTSSFTSTLSQYSSTSVPNPSTTNQDGAGPLHNTSVASTKALTGDKSSTSTLLGHQIRAIKTLSSADMPPLTDSVVSGERSGSGSYLLTIIIVLAVSLAALVILTALIAGFLFWRKNKRQKVGHKTTSFQDSTKRDENNMMMQMTANQT